MWFSSHPTFPIWAREHKNPPTSQSHSHSLTPSLPNGNNGWPLDLRSSPGECSAPSCIRSHCNVVSVNQPRSLLFFLPTILCFHFLSTPLCFFSIYTPTTSAPSSSFSTFTRFSATTRATQIGVSLVVHCTSFHCLSSTVVVFTDCFCFWVSFYFHYECYLLCFFIFFIFPILFYCTHVVVLS